MKKIQKKPACVTRCKRGSSKIHKKPDTRSVAATRMANTRAQKAAHKKKKQVTNIRTRAKKALQQERPYTPKTADTKLKKIVADMHRSITKKVENADKKSDAATATADQCQNLAEDLVLRNLDIERRQNSSEEDIIRIERTLIITEQKCEKFELRLQGFERLQSQPQKEA